MSVLYKDLNLKTDDSVKLVDINGIQVEVKQYLPVDVKANIIELATTGSVINGCVSETLMDAYLHTFIVENYTNIKFDEEDIADIFRIFDELNSTGILESIIRAIKPSEYDFIFSVAERAKNNLNLYNQSYAKGMTMLSGITEQKTS
jgi:hypothetical protein